MSNINNYPLQERMHTDRDGYAFSCNGVCMCVHAFAGKEDSELRFKLEQITHK